MTKNIPLHALVALAVLPALAAPACAEPAATPRTPPAVLGAAKTIQFTATELLGRESTPMKVSTAYLAVPNKAFIQDMDARTKAIDTIYASDGKTQTEYRQSSNRYTKSDAAARFADLETSTIALSSLTVFLTPEAFAKYHHASSDPIGIYKTLLGKQEGKTIEGVLALDPATGFPSSLSIFITPSKNPDVPAERIAFTNWKLNAPMNEAKFAYTPPASATLYTPPQMLANGTQAPDFTANDKDGKPVKLSDYKGKVVVLDFWATWCGPCQMSLPHTTTLAKRYADQSVTVLAVNVWDKPDAFQAWLPKHPEYAALHFAIDPSTDDSKGIATGLYGVSGIPTQYIIGKDGRVVKSIVGYDEGSTALEDALKAAGAG